MTQMLISVTSVEEAQIALEHGADIIDLKDPSSGALGALPMPQIKAVVDYVRSRNLADVRTSATIGDLPMQPDLILEQVILLAASKVDIIKIGFFPTEDYQPCLDVLNPLIQKGLKLIAVLFSEREYADNLIAAIRNAGFIGVMLDTAVKNSLTFFDHYSEEQQLSFSRQVLDLGLTFGLAGSLRLQHVAAVKKMQPTYVGFRGGVCADNQRQLSLSASKIKAIRELL